MHFAYCLKSERDREREIKFGSTVEYATSALSIIVSRKIIFQLKDPAGSRETERRGDSDSV